MSIPSNAIRVPCCNQSDLWYSPTATIQVRQCTHCGTSVSVLNRNARVITSNEDNKNEHSNNES